MKFTRLLTDQELVERYLTGFIPDEIYDIPVHPYDVPEYYRNARSSLYSIADVDSAVIDTSAVTESQSFAATIKILDPQRIRWGSDFPVSENIANLY